MKRYLYSITLACALLSAGAREGFCAEEANADVTYVIPIKGMIERGLVYALRRGMEEAEALGAGAIVIDMDTPGGRLDSATEIVHLLLGASVPTYTLVNPSAMSAGAIISLATDEIYMVPSGLLGDAMPIMMSPLPMGGPQELPEGIKEKAVSPTVALARSAAQAKGHDTQLAEAMIRPEFEYKIGDKVICPAGQLLTLTSEDAAQLVGEDEHPLLAKGIVKDLDELLEKIGRDKNKVVTVEITPAEQIARFIESIPVSGVLLALGLLGLYIEFKTPGFGFPGMAGILCLAVWFWGHHIAGLAGMGEMAIFLVGVILVLIEIFAIPGFGAVGVSGLTLIIVSLLMAMVQHYPSEPWYLPPVAHFQRSVVTFGEALVITLISAAILARFLPKTSVFQRIALGTSMSRAAGYEAAHEEAGLIGQRGVTVTPLRPAGIAEFGDKHYNVVARGEFLEKGSSIVVAEVRGNRIVVDHGC